MKIKARFNRFMVYLRKANKSVRSSVDSKIELDEVQETAFQIVKRMMRNPESELIYAPITQIYYVECGHYYIRMVDGSLSITNGKLSYHVWLPEAETSELKKTFDKVSQTRSYRLEKNYNQSTLQNLKDVLASVSPAINN